MIRPILLAALIASPAWAQTPAPLTDDDFLPVNMDEVRLGQLLFYDPILSGNRNISCATCHHPKFATTDGVSLGMGEGGIGLGPARKPDPANTPEQRIPRNAPALFNLGALEFRVLFHDGRVEVDPARPSGMRTPLEDDMVIGFSGILSAQTMFPVLSPDEMAGHYQENDVAKAIRRGIITGPGGAWQIISDRVAAIPAYADMFAQVYPPIAKGKPVAFTDISNAIAGFMAFEWRADDSAFDRTLRGEATLAADAQRGMDLFFGDLGCSGCHAGKFLTDQSFHAMGQPQLGPGKAERFETHSRDIGRMRVTNRREDAYAFRTPMLRNVTATGPWGHAGAFSDLAAFLVHHADPTVGMDGYIPQATLPEFTPAKSDWAVTESAEDRAAIGAAATAVAPMGPHDMAPILAFLESLRDDGAIRGRLGVPDTVPSGLPVDR